MSYAGIAICFCSHFLLFFFFLHESFSNHFLPFSVGRIYYLHYWRHWKMKNILFMQMLKFLALNINR